MNPVLALGLLAAAGLLATRLPRLPSRHSPHLDLAIAAGAPLVLLGLVLGPGIELLRGSALPALAPLTALAIGWVGAVLGARFEWRAVRCVPRAAWLLATAAAAGAFLVVAVSAWLLTRWVPPLGAAWAPHLAVLGLAAVAAVSGPAAVVQVAQLLGVRRSVSRALGRAAALETACGALVMSVPLALHRPPWATGNPAVRWLSWAVLAAGSGALVGLVFLSLTRLRPAREDVGLALLGGVLFGAGIGYAMELSPFIVCALAAVVIVNASPRRREARAVLAQWEQAITAVVLLVAGALLVLPTVWLLVAVPLLGALRAAGRWAGVRSAVATLPRRDAWPHAGLATVAQGSAAVALGVNYAMVYGRESPGDAAGAVLTTVVLGVALAQLAAPSLMRLALAARPAPLTPVPARPELTTNAPAD